MKTVYFIYNNYSPNNAANNRALAYLRSFSQLHYEVTVIFLMPDVMFSRMKEELPYIHVEYCWEKNYINKKFFKNISYFRYLIDFYRRVHTGDIVYFYGGFDLFWLVLHKRGVNVFFECTEHPLVYPPSGRLIHPSLKAFFKSCKKAKGLFVISTCLRDYFVDNGVALNKITIIKSIVDISRFSDLDKQQSPIPYFAYCGNGNNRKDKVDELIRVFAHVAERHKRVQLYIIGPTKQVYKEEQDNVQLVHQLGLDDRIIFTGIKPAEEIPQILVDATALFLTRPDTLQNRAGFSTKLGEYLASGNPVVAAGVGDIPLYLHDKENAFVFAPGDFKAVESAMIFILEHPDEANKIGKAGRITAHENFNALTETKTMIKVFECIT